MIDKSLKGPWILIGVVILLMVAFLALLIHLFYPTQLLLMVSIMAVLLASSYALAMSYRTRKFLEKEVETKVEALAEAHAFQQSILDGIDEPIMVIGEDYQVKMMNRAAIEFSSGCGSTPVSSLCYQISHTRERPCDGIRHPCPLEEVRKSGQFVTVVHEHCQANGEQRMVEIIASPHWDTNGNFQGIIESMRDVTERKREEDALQQYADRLRSLTAQLAVVEDTERQRFSQELHDQVGQNLTALGINLNIIRSQLPEGTVEPIHLRLDDSLSLVDKTAEQIRDLMADLRPPVLDDYGLVAALNWYGEQFAWRTDIAIAVEGEEPLPRLPTHIENALFRIAQEALNNVAKHAQATQVTVRVETDDESLRLVIADNGIGFDPAQLAEPDGGPGWGLLTMTERAESVGGYCSIESSPEKGSVVVVRVCR